MKIVVVGAGALGAYFGARWQEAGQDVTFLVRHKRADQLRKNGLRIQSREGDYQLDKPVLIEDAAEVQQADLVLLAVKGYHLDGTLDQLQVLVDKGAKVLPVLNGIEHLPILQERLGKDAVLGGLSFIISTLDEQGGVDHTSPFHELVFGPLIPEQEEICREIAAVSETANFTARWSEDIETDMWKKYMFITSFSGITTAADLPIGTIRNHPETFAVAKAMLVEMKQLANKQQVDLTDDHVEQAIRQLNGLDDAATSSMHQDRRKGISLEVEHLHGGALRLAAKEQIELPTIRAIFGLIKPFA
ncbi:2-dehydropantoate 2-reductase [Sediminibacillus dalangtanensis]|uniref:2-dehydropantoate 2-reductase n=1 Tax=Sediminibacillus dalangtanensis TaxID=2729421 RepID=A0ABX7VX66_9BACI|nr:ketopantoate reductase family protein [Sediminibacillus dalangtanensis]QTN00346.1 2-dehydropantoate 2-reductase [Sediminibacillus dalangtanensis]